MGGDDKVAVQARLIDAELKAILVLADGHEEATWLPSKLVTYDEDARLGGQVTVTMPRWLAEERGLV